MAHIEKCDATMIPQWVALRIALWPDEDPEIMAREAPGMLDQPGLLVLVARTDDAVTAFVEAAIRRDYVNGCETSPVAFIEGIYVMPEHRGRGVARALIGAVAIGRGPCTGRWDFPKPNAWSISEKR